MLNLMITTPGAEVTDVLGKGGFATVRIGRERKEPHRVVAVKIINPKISADPRQQKVILEEVATMVKVNTLNNKNLLHFVAAHEDFSTTTQSNRLTIVSREYPEWDEVECIVVRMATTPEIIVSGRIKIHTCALYLHAS